MHELSLPSPAEYRRKSFPVMVAASLLLHSLVAISLFAGRQHGAITAPATFIDMRMVTEEAPPTFPGDDYAPEEPTEPDVTPTPQPAQQSATAALQQQMEEALNAAPSRPEAVHSVSFGLGMANGYFNSLGEGKTLLPEIREYYLSLLERVNQTWWLENRGQTGWASGAVLNVVIARDGTLLNMELVKGSGNPARDQAIMEALRKSSPLPPLPENYSGYFFKAPLRFVAPLSLMEPAPAAPHG